MRGRPDDSYWREFRGIPGRVAPPDNCWYCERHCLRESDDGGKAPTVDHFRPLSRFPELAYQWSNWIFSCYRCNADNKGGRWPDSGYVDPSASSEEERPERYFDYDAVTGEIIPKPGLTSEAQGRAQRTIDDLGLNKLDVRFYRLDWTRRFIEDWLALTVEDRSALVEFAARAGYEFVGASLMAVRQQRE